MKFGKFDDAKREYVISTPQTPYPWINYLGCNDFFSIMSNTAGGYSFYKDARLRRITRYRYNDIPIDGNGKYFYISDGQDVWNPGFRPCNTELDSYECAHGLGYTRITGAKNQVQATQLSFVPLNDNCEIHKITVKNTGSAKKEVKLFSYVEFCLWNALDDFTNFQRNLNTGEVEIDGSAIYHKTEYRERRDHYSFYSVNTPIDAFDTDRETFKGLYNGLGEAQNVQKGQLANSVASGWSPIAAHQINISLDAGEEKDFIFILGYIENKEEEKWEAQDVINKTNAKNLQEKYSSTAKVDKSLEELQKHWDKLLSIYNVSSEDEKMNRMVNIWNAYQCMVTFNLSRSTSYFESGIGRGMGFRDSNQDIIGFVHQIPGEARQRIIDIASTQFEDGSAFHQYQPLTKKGNHDIGGGFNDDPLWLILSTAAYIKETGDMDFLDEVVMYGSDPSKTGTMFDHVKASFYHPINNKGPHGLPLIGRADWNDCLNLNCFSTTPDESFQTYGDPDGRVAESIFIAGLFVFVGQDFVELCKRKGLTEEAEKAAAHIEEMKKTVMEHGYDGDWFLRAYDAFGNKLGSNENEEGKIYIEPQGMCVMAEIGKEDGSALKALNSVEKYLDSKYGIVLVNPPYTKYDKNIGEITSYPPGYKENAGIFCHNNPWVLIAETVMGRGDRAYEIFRKTSPAHLEEISEVHRTEPYVYSQMIAGKDAVNHGEAKNSWLTGTAAWTYVSISQWILGIRPGFDGLIVDPAIPSTMKGFTVKRSFRGATYTITVDNKAGVQKGVKKITIDGKEGEGNVIPIFSDGKEHKVEVELG